MRPLALLFALFIGLLGSGCETDPHPIPPPHPPAGSYPGDDTVHHLYEPERIIHRAYRDLLGRRPDEEGLRNYRRRIIDQGWTEAQVRDAIRNSHEYRVLRAEVVIRRAYQDLLDRDPDPEGLATYTRLWQRGYTERMIRDRIRNSREYKELQRRR
ncbi:MAG: hypothetical protein EA425_05540 [Puniceicoccaceae bacterium]|nr:MAG: hypothetical protein EA425_05540 [Puniceicoccaceae bacterium]